MNIIKTLNLYRLSFSKEFRDIKEIILKGKDKKRKSESNIWCDKVFIDRLERNPFALLMNYWENHFEWRDLMKDYPMIKGQILDFGCGSGHSDILLARNGKNIYGVDLSPIGIEIANYLKSKEREEVKQRLSFELRDITSQNDLEIKFDSAWSSHVFEHIADPEPAIKGIKQYLKRKGPFLISVPYGHAYDDPGHIHHFYTENDLKEYLRPYIKVERVDLNKKNQVLRAICIND